LCCNKKNKALITKNYTYFIERLSFFNKINHLLFFFQRHKFPFCKAQKTLKYTPKFYNILIYKAPYSYFLHKKSKEYFVYKILNTIFTAENIKLTFTKNLI